MSSNEELRLEALYALNILDTPPEERFDRITRLAAAFFKVPIALLSLIDSERQWFKSRCGIEPSEMGRSSAFCAFAIQSNEPLVVENAWNDPRFASNPAVIGNPFIRFYAGQPIFSLSGHAIGTLCIADTQPRHLSIEQIVSLQDFANLAEHEISRTTVAVGADQLATANEQLEALSYSIAHDLRSPLRAIDGFTKIFIAEHSKEINKEDLIPLEKVRAATQKMSQLINDLLRLAGVGRHEFRRDKVDLSKIAESIAIDLQNTNKDRAVEFSIEPNVMVEGDGKLLRISLENLLGNAWKFTAKNSAPRIEFGAFQQDGAQVCVVRDNGAGFDMAYANKLFGPFQRLHSVNEFEGTGIGLAIVHRIIQRHAGRIWAESDVGKGTTFNFIL